MTIVDNPTPANIPPYTPVYRHDSSLAIASLICGIATWFMIPVIGAIAAVITGHLAKKEIRESGGTLTGDGMAVTGLVLGYIQLGLLVLAVFCAVAFFVSLAAGGTTNLTGPSAFISSLML
jgi:hypothetical protein